MKIKTLICAFLCVLLMGMTVFAAQNTEESLSDNVTEQSETAAPTEEQALPQGQRPANGAAPEGGTMPQGGFGGRGGGRGEIAGEMQGNREASQAPANNNGTQQGGGAAAESAENIPAENEQNVPPQGGAMPQGEFGGFGGRGGMGGNMQMPGQQQMENGSSQTETTVDVDYSTVTSAAILLVLGFFFVIFYKRKTF